MKKLLSTTLIILVALLLVFPVISFIGITVANDCIAAKVEKELTSYPLPDKTVLVDSLSVAGKLTGNGNGMQYMGAVLITSELDQQTILEHYQNEFDYVEVHRQISETINSLHPDSVTFKRFDHDNDTPSYSVICWGSRSDYVSNDIAWILDFDIRGH